MHRRISQFHDSLRWFTKVIIRLPEDKTVYYERGICYQLMGNQKLAEQDFLKAIEIDPKFADAIFHLGKS